MVHVQRQVTHQGDAAGGGGGAQPGPLGVEAPGQEAPEVELGAGFADHGGQGLGLAPSQRGGPARPGRAQAGVEQHEERVIVEPRGFPGGVGGQFGAFVRAGAGLKALPGLAQARGAVGHDGIEVAARCLEVGRRGFVQPASGDELVEVDQPGAAGEGRGALVGRLTGPGRGQWQHLPKPLARAGEPVQKVVRVGAEVARAVTAGQAGGVQQDAAAAAGQQRMGHGRVGVHGRGVKVRKGCCPGWRPAPAAGAAPARSEDRGRSGPRSGATRAAAGRRVREMGRPRPGRCRAAGSSGRGAA